MRQAVMTEPGKIEFGEAEEPKAGDKAQEPVARKPEETSGVDDLHTADSEDDDEEEDDDEDLYDDDDDDNNDGECDEDD